MPIVDWNQAPVGTTHICVPNNLPNPLHQLRTWEKWVDGKVYFWNDEIQEWDLLSYSDKLVDKNKRAPNPNIGHI